MRSLSQAGRRRHGRGLTKPATPVWIELVAIKVLSRRVCIPTRDFRDRFAREAEDHLVARPPRISAPSTTSASIRGTSVSRHAIPRRRDARRAARSHGPILMSGCATGSQSRLRTSSGGRRTRTDIVHRDLKPGNVISRAPDAPPARLRTGETISSRSETSASVLRYVDRAASGRGHRARHAARHVPVHGARAAGRRRSGRTVRHLRAFGCVLYELVSGRKAFSGTSRAGLIGAILKDAPPPLTSVPLPIPPALDHVVRTCLAKDPDERWQSAGDVRRELGSIVQSSGPHAMPPPGARRRASLAPWIVAAFSSALAVVALAFVWRDRPAASTDARAVRIHNLAAVQPDTRRRRRDGAERATCPVPGWAATGLRRRAGRRRAIRVVGSLARAGAGADAARHGRRDRSVLVTRQPIARVPGRRQIEAPGHRRRPATNHLRRVGRRARRRMGRGQRHRVLARHLQRLVPRLRLWRADVTAAPAAVARHLVSLAVVPARRPAFLFFVRSSDDRKGVYVSSVTAPTMTRVLDTPFNGMFAPPGYLVTVRDGALIAFPFDADALRVTPDPFSSPRKSADRARNWAGSRSPRRACSPIRAG